MMLTRDEVEQRLVESDLNLFNNFNNADAIDYLTDILTNGFKGYHNLIVHELEDEYNTRFSLEGDDRVDIQE